MIIWYVSEFIAVVRYLYQLPVVSDTFVFVAISPVSYFRCQILVVRYSVVRYQLSVIRLPAIIDITVVGDISYSLIITHIDCLLIKDTITRGTGIIAWWCMSCILGGLIMLQSCGFQPWGTKVVLATYSVVRSIPRLRRHTSCFFIWGCGLSY